MDGERRRAKSFWGGPWFKATDCICGQIVDRGAYIACGEEWRKLGGRSPDEWREPTYKNLGIPLYRKGASKRAPGMVDIHSSFYYQELDFHFLLLSSWLLLFSSTSSSSSSLLSPGCISLKGGGNTKESLFECVPRKGGNIQLLKTSGPSYSCSNLLYTLKFQTVLE